jgi:hypothetical protein
MAQTPYNQNYKLEIGLDASGIKDFKPDQQVKVVAIDGKGAAQETVTTLSASGKGTATLTFPENPGALRVLIGPENASAEEFEGLQTIRMDVSARNWEAGTEVKLPITISPYYWWWWYRWCRTFTINGVVRCADGSPVPGAQVCAFDVDWWWWWISQQQVGCATTDANGAFQITFRWCCGWWPWWWWRNRFWRLEPLLVDRILPVLQQDSSLLRVKVPSPQPSLDLFEGMLAEQGALTRRPAARVDPALLPGLRDRLLKRLPQAPALERLRIWPWWPWYPWWDCTPDIIFRVTQNCHGQDTVIVDESFGDTRWDIPNPLNVTLVANDKACCTPVINDPPGNCMVIDRVCSDHLNTIGGNAGAPAAPLGYVNPGANAVWGDRPYAGGVRIEGQFGLGATADYYEFEWSTDNVHWNPMPPPAAGGFTRYIFIPLATYVPVPFNFVPIGGRNVIESRRHYEATHPAAWGSTQFWTSDEFNTLMWWLTNNNFVDGTYYLRVRTWELQAGNLINDHYLPVCNTIDENRLVLTIDNRFVGVGPTDSNGHPCGSGTVHTCTAEPDTDIVSVKIIHADSSEIRVDPCGNVPINDTDVVQIDFVAHDPDGHLAYYTLDASYDVNLSRNLLALGGTLTPSPFPAWAPPAAQVGPDYGSAIAQGATHPIWQGGTIRLEMLAKTAFPETCCYQLELRAYKRTIDSCDYNYPHRNVTQYSFMIVV